MQVHTYLRRLPPPDNLFLVPGRSPKSCIIQTRSVENDILCWRAVTRIPYFLASATSLLLSAISYDIRTDDEPFLVENLPVFIVMSSSSKQTSFDNWTYSSSSYNVQSKSPYNNVKLNITCNTLEPFYYYINAYISSSIVLCVSSGAIRIQCWHHRL